MRGWRILCSVTGIVLLLYGATRLLIGVPILQVVEVGLWMIGAIVIHDGIIAPLTVAVGALIGRVVPPRARRFLQVFLIIGGLITVIAVPLILRRNSQPASKAILTLDYSKNLSILLAIVAAISLLLYCAQVIRDHGGSNGREDGSSGNRDHRPAIE